MGVQAEFHGPVVMPLVDLVVHAAHLDVAAQRRVLVAEHARVSTGDDARLVPHACDAHPDADAEDPVEAKLEEHLAAEQRCLRVPRGAHDRRVCHPVVLDEPPRDLPRATVGGIPSALIR